MSNNQKDQIGIQTAFTLSSLLVTISTIFISVLATNSVKSGKILLGLIGFLCVATSALLVDWVLDDIIGKVWHQRLSYLNGGYIFFTIIMSMVCYGVLHYTYFALHPCNNGLPKRVFALFLFTSLFLWLKTIAKEDHHCFIIALIVFAILSFLSMPVPLFQLHLID